MRRIIHLSDLHFPIRDAARLAALEAAIRAEAPALVVITGDLTRAGRRREFEAARDFVGRLTAPVFAVAGNHDVPVFHPAARLFKPFARFARYFPCPPLITFPEDDMVLAGLDTAQSISASSWDWSLGAIDEGDLTPLALTLGRAPPGALKMVACHHPLIADPADPYRSRTKGGIAALHRLASLDVAILFHGHLHRSSSRMLPAGARSVLSIGAGTLSERERGAGTGFNRVEINGLEVSVTEILWAGNAFQAGSRMTHQLPGDGTNRRLPN